MLNLKISELIRINNETSLEDGLNRPQVKIRILSNITISQIVHPLKYCLNNNGINSTILIGEYDNLIQESIKIDDSEIPIIFWELSNIKESFYYEIEARDDNYKEEFFCKVQDELNLLFSSLSKSRIVIFNEFSHLPFTSNLLEKGQFENFVDDLNKYLHANKPANFYVVPISKIFANLSMDQSVDLRGYYSSKSLYTFLFLKSYSLFILPIFLSLYAKSKKILVLDCDNTIWHGIVGEDGTHGVGISEKDKYGVFFKEVQLIALSLYNKGILLALASKNNVDDVIDVFKNREDLNLNLNNFVKYKVNWNDKATNIMELSNELNIGIDSFVFVDDSEFETNLVSKSLPNVQIIKVPTTLFLYPKILNSYKNLFFQLSQTVEDLRRTDMYIEENMRKEEFVKFTNLEDYLRSLNLQIEIGIDEIENIDRISQMTQKTNQFNLCTRRYSSSEIGNFIKNNKYTVFDLRVTDKFGDSGISGVCIVYYKENCAIIDNLLLSCRILGRNIENEFLNKILSFLFKNNIQEVLAQYIRSPKNDQVCNFYEKIAFETIMADINEKSYCLKKENFIEEPLNYIESLWKKK